MPTIGQVLALLVPAPAFTWWMPANAPTTIITHSSSIQ
jgi:hypothetical protein